MLPPWSRILDGAGMFLKSISPVAALGGLEGPGSMSFVGVEGRLSG